MTYDFVCEAGHVTSLYFRTIGYAIAYFEDPGHSDTYESVRCTVCGAPAARDYRGTATMFYGEGWDKPAPSGRQNTIGADPHKALSSLGHAELGRRA